MAMPVSARSKRWVCGHSLDRIVGSHPTGVMDVCCECCVLPGTDLCFGPISLPEESHRVWPWGLDNEETLAHKGLLRHGGRWGGLSKTSMFEVSGWGRCVSESRPYEANWVITDQPRCCSDCTYVAAGFKCKVKSCLHNCPWARSAGKCFTDCRIEAR